jgi:trehalose 6-phosphate phosphatase
MESMNPREALEYIVAQRPLALVTDFDGTISEISPTPGQAKVHPRCRELLAELSGELPLVAVLSGRPAADVQMLVGLPGIDYIGNHGLSRWEKGHTHVDPSVSSHLSAIHSIAEEARRVLAVPGLLFEENETGVAIHYRSTPDPASVKSVVVRVLQDLVSGTEIKIQEGRLVVELRPPVSIDKGTAIFELLEGRAVSGAIYAGDDRTDLDAFAGLRRWSQQEDTRSLAVAVNSLEMPPGLREAADLCVDGVEGWADFLDALQNTLSPRDDS